MVSGQASAARMDMLTYGELSARITLRKLDNYMRGISTNGCQLDGINGVPSEQNFGRYMYVNSAFRWTANLNTTTQHWIGNKLPYDAILVTMRDVGLRFTLFKVLFWRVCSTSRMYCSEPFISMAAI